MPRPLHILNKLLAVFMLSATVFGVVACSGAAERESKYLQSAEKYYKEGNYKKAKVEVKNVLQINPKNSQSRVILGRINQSEQDYRSAFQNFKAALEEDGKQIDARIELAKIYLSAGKEAEAKQYVDEVLAINPAVNEAKAISAGLSLKAGDRDTAERVANEVNSAEPSNYQAIAVLASLNLERDPAFAISKIDAGIQLDPKSEQLKLLKIEVLKRTQKIEQADNIYLALIKDHPENFKYYDRLASSYTQQKRYDEAEKIVRMAIENNPKSPEPILALVQFINGIKSPEKAVDVLKEFIDKKPEIYVLKQALVNHYIQDNKISDAKQLLTSVIEKGGKNSEAVSARVDLAQIYLSQNEQDKAVQMLDDIFAIEPTNTEARILSAKVKLSQNKVKDAIADLRAAIKNDARSLVAFKLLAVAQEKDGSPELALDSYFRALDINSDDLASLFGAARLSIENKNEDTARKLLSRILQLNPSNLEASALMVNLMVNKREFDAAEKLCQSLIATDNLANKATGFNLLAKVYGSQDKWSVARENYTKALEISPKSFDPIVGMANAWLAEEQVAKAVSVVEDYVKKYPDTKQAKHLLADLYFKQKNIQGAVDLYEGLIASFPKDEGLYQNLASIYFQKKDIVKVESIYNDGLKANPESVALRVYLGNFYSATKRYSQAKEQYEAANTRAPQVDLVKNNLAVLLVNELSSPENIQKAVTLVSGFANSKEANYIDTLGWVQYAAGNTPQAISYLQKAVSMKDIPEFRYHLGMAFKKNGQNAEAKKELDLALKDANVSGDWVDVARKNLAEL